MVDVVQQYEHMLHPVKGYTPNFVCLDKTAPADSTLLRSVTAWPAGRVGYITNTGTIALANGANLTRQMPLYLWQGGFDLGVLSRGVGADGTVYWENAMPAGMITGLVATGGYEIQTTEFNTSQTYAPNTFLTATVDSDNVPGILTPISGSVAANWVCGIASLHCQERYDLQTTPTSAKGVNAYGRPVLTFWSYFLPKTA